MTTNIHQSNKRITPLLSFEHSRLRISLASRLYRLRCKWLDHGTVTAGAHGLLVTVIAIYSVLSELYKVRENTISLRPE